MIPGRTFRSCGERFALMAAHSVDASEPRVPIGAPAAAALLAPLFLDPLDAAELRRLCATLDPAAPTRDDREVLARLIAALVLGRLVKVHCEPTRAWSYRARPRVERPAPDESPPSQSPMDATHWIEIQLVDADDSGVAGQRYLIITPDGRQFQGYTDSLGSARITRLPPGTCQVSFPDLDTDAVTQVATHDP